MIKASIQSIRNFAFGSLSSNQSEKFIYYAQRFLEARTFGEAERKARQFMTFILYQHEKNTVVGQVLESMNNFELYEVYSYNSQRLHYIHQANVFLLGLFIYHNFPQLKSELWREMENTTSDETLDLKGMKLKWRYSGDSPEGEFFYRWRLSSLSHDIGYGISLSEKDLNRMKPYFDEISTFTYSSIESLSDLWTVDDVNLLDLMDRKLGDSRISRYMQYQMDKPFKGSVFYDHGLIGAIIFLRLIHEEYARHRNNPVTLSNSSRIIWDPHILNTSIMESAIAIALHNMDHYDENYKIQFGESRIFDLEKKPLAWLLKISDLLQQWDKPEAHEEIMAQKIPLTQMEIFFERDKICLNHLPKPDETKRIIDRYTNPVASFEFL
jgi:hypothetical protein